MFRLLQPRYFVVTVIVAALALMGVRIESLHDSLISGTAFTPIAAATAEDSPPKTADKAPADAEQKAETPAAAPAVEPPAVAMPTAMPPTVAAPPEDLSEGDVEVLKQLSARRALLDEREQEMSQKVAILQATEMRVDQKVKQMETLHTQLKAMLGQLDEQQQAQIDNLVKIYESMKPKEAARIFQTLDMPVLLGVMRQMKPARSAPILAEMEPQKAKEITLTLAKQHELPGSDDKESNLPKAP
ncbi:MAG: hypothetical protein WDO70_07400 [Alphaproteobacteria bacterium]